MSVPFNNTRIEVRKGDLTKESVDAIVNAANKTLLGGGGVDGAIDRAGGLAILEACRKLIGCSTGDAKITTGGTLSAKYVIHTVGPIYEDGKHDEALLLASCYRRSLEVALEYNVKSIAFPAISCGVYGYPHKDAALIAMHAVRDFFDKHEGINLIRFILFSHELYTLFDDALKEVFKESF